MLRFAFFLYGFFIRDAIGDLLSNLYVELGTKRCYDELEGHISNILKKKEDFKILQETTAKHKM